MPSLEEKMLSDFLLAPAALRDFMTLREFTAIFPRAHRDSPAVMELYHELQRLRERDMDTVRRDIADEVKRSKRLRRDYAQERSRLDSATVAGLDHVAREMEEELSGTVGKSPHTLRTVHANVEAACDHLETQIAELEQENEQAIQHVQEMVGGLSDLRQGRFSQAASGEELGGEVLATLRHLETICSEALE